MPRHCSILLNISSRASPLQRRHVNLRHPDKRTTHKMSARRGRKKAAPKAAAAAQHAEDVLDIQALQDPVTGKPTAPPSPIVAIAKQAITPVVAAATKIVSIAASSLPAIPEASAVNANVVEMDSHPSSTPRSPPAAAQHNPFTAAADLDTHGQHHGSAASHEYTNTSSMQQQNSLDDDLDLQPVTAPSIPAAAATAPRLQDCLNNIASQIVSHRSTFLQAVQGLVLLVLLGVVFSQGSAIRTQQATITVQQQQVHQHESTLHTLQGQLQQAQQELQAMSSTQQLQNVEASCSAGLGQLNTTQASLHSNMQSLDALAQQLQANISSVSQTTQLGEKAYKMLATIAVTAGAGTTQSSNTGASEAAASDSAAAALPLSALLQQNLQQQELAQQLQQSMMALDSLSDTIKQEVQQQLEVQLPPADLALADCGARVVFHTAINASALQSLIQPTASTASRDTVGVMHWLHQQLKQLLQEHLYNHITQQQQQQQQQHRQLMSAAQINSILLRPQAAVTAEPAATGSFGQLIQQCVPLLLGPHGSTSAHTAAVVEIALPQMMAIEGVTLHHPVPSPLSQHRSWYDTAPGGVFVALANSSSCSRGVCSAAAQRAITNSSNDSEDAPYETGGIATSVLAAGVVGVQQAVQVDADTLSSKHAVVHFHGEVRSAGGGGVVVADRVVVHVSSSMSGAEGVCMHRVSVQGKPLEPASFC